MLYRNINELRSIASKTRLTEFFMAIISTIRGSKSTPYIYAVECSKISNRRNLSASKYDPSEARHMSQYFTMALPWPFNLLDYLQSLSTKWLLQHGQQKYAARFVILGEYWCLRDVFS